MTPPQGRQVLDACRRVLYDWLDAGNLCTVERTKEMFIPLRFQVTMKLRDVTVTISHHCDMLLATTTAPTATAFPIVQLIIDANCAILNWLRDLPLPQS